MNVWENIQQKLRKTLPPHEYQLWIEGITAEKQSDGLTLWCRNVFTQKRIAMTYAESIKEAYREQTSQECILDYRIQPPPQPVQASLPLPLPAIGIDIKLPDWPDEERGAPAAIIRSAIFGIVKRGQRRVLENESIASWSGVEVKCTLGYQLDQADLDVWLESLHRCRSLSEVQRVHFSAYDFLKSIGRATGQSDHKWLQKAIDRLNTYNVKIKKDGFEYSGPLIYESFKNPDGHYVIALNAQVAQLFDDDYVWINSEDRKRLSGDFQKWLHAYVCSHKATDYSPHKISLKKLKELCGSQEKTNRNFKIQIRHAMEKLQSIEVIQSFTITSNNVLEFVRVSRSAKEKSKPEPTPELTHAEAAAALRMIEKKMNEK